MAPGKKRKDMMLERGTRPGHICVQPVSNATAPLLLLQLHACMCQCNAILVCHARP